MREVDTWDIYFMKMANHVATRSKDPMTQVGAVLVDENNHVIATGYNGFPPGVEETEDRWARPVKYDRVIHAEMNAIAHAARKGHATEGATLYCTHFPCNKTGCTRLVIAAGIKKVRAGMPPHGWDDDHKYAGELLEDAGVDAKVYAYNGLGELRAKV